jgi:cell division transport system permease protein
VILIFGFLGNELSDYVKENINITVVLNDDMTDVQIRKLRDNFETKPYVKSTEYISKEQASLEMQKELGENPETFLGFNPFYASIEVKLNSQYSHPDSLVKIEKQFSTNSNVSDVVYRKDMLQTVNKNIRLVGLVLSVLLVILILISFVLINNTVRLLIYSKRFLIYTMRLVGATNGFIRRPFIRHNILTGLIAGILAIGLLMGTLYYVNNVFSGFNEILNPDTLLILYAIVLFSGILLSVIAAYFAVNKYLSMARGELYYI